MTCCHVPVSAALTSQQDIPQTPTVFEKLSLKLQSKERGLATGALSDDSAEELPLWSPQSPGTSLCTPSAESIWGLPQTDTDIRAEHQHFSFSLQENSVPKYALKGSIVVCLAHATLDASLEVLKIVVKVLHSSRLQHF